jgi:hypothetical protein
MLAKQRLLSQFVRCLRQRSSGRQQRRAQQRAMPGKRQFHDDASLMNEGEGGKCRFAVGFRNWPPLQVSDYPVFMTKMRGTPGGGRNLYFRQCREILEFQM